MTSSSIGWAYIPARMKTEVTRHRCRNCWKIASMISTSWLRAKRSRSLPRNTTKPLIYHEMVLDFAMVCNGLQDFAIS